MNRISQYLKARVNLLALLICGFFSGFWVLLLAKGWYYFALGQSRDTGYNAQILWGILHGSLEPSILNANFIVDHCYFLAFLIAPLYWLCPDPLLLQYLKIVMFFSGAYVFFLILKKYLDPWIALGAMIAFSLAPANVSMLLGLFNYETFAIVLIFLIFKAMIEDDIKVYIICCFIMFLVKEQMPLVVMMFGVLAFFVKKEKKIIWALLPFIAGLLFFIFEIFILTPYLRKDFPMSADHYWTRYMQFGNTPQHILFYILTHPSHILKQFVLMKNIEWYNNLFSVWGGLGFLSPHILLVAAPLYLKAALSSNSQEQDVLYLGYYSSIFTPFIYLAVWNTLNQIRNRWRLAIHVLVLSIMFIHALIFIPQRLGYLNLPITNSALAKRRFIDMIPPDASVLSALRTYDVLANRKELYPVSVYLKGKYLVSEKKFELTDRIDYLLLDLENEQLLTANARKYVPKMAALNFDDRWRLQGAIENIALYVKNPSRERFNKLIERSFEPFQVVKNNPQTFDNIFSLEGIEFPSTFPQKYRIFPVTMYWKCIEKTNTAYGISFAVSSSDGRAYYSKYRDIGTAIYPTYSWSRGEYVKESYFYLFPHMPRGKYTIQIFIYNTSSKKWVGNIEKNFFVS